MPDKLIIRESRRIVAKPEALPPFSSNTRSPGVHNTSKYILSDWTAVRTAV
jgi:hypothetical protein